MATEHPFEVTLASRGVSALAGRNGSGKSVILSAIAGLHVPEQVGIRWHATPAAPPILATQYPELQIFEDRVRDEVVYAAISRGRSRTDATHDALRHLERLGIESDRFMGLRCWDLSAGEKRVLQLVAVLIAPASLVLLDEPTAGLDATRRDRLAALVTERGDHDAVLIASQDSDWTRRVGATVHSLEIMRPKVASLSKKTD